MPRTDLGNEKGAHRLAQSLSPMRETRGKRDEAV
jgi:hypothetical protein